MRFCFSHLAFAAFLATTARGETSSEVFGPPALPGIDVPVSSTSARFLYEARLRGGNGEVLSGKQRISLAIFRGGDAQTPDSGILLYGETAEVDAKHGHVAHAVGSGAATYGSPLNSETLAQSGLTGDADQVLWLQVSVGEADQRVILPRTRLGAVAFAAYAANAGSLGGWPASAYVKSDDLQNERNHVAKLAGSGGPTSFIGVNNANQATNVYSTVVGGQYNIASGTYSSILGGRFNKAIGGNSNIAGGSYNEAHGLRAVIAGGFTNKVFDDYGVVAGGSGNLAGGTDNNTLNDPYPTIAGGESNASRKHGFVGGGKANHADHFASVAGGQNNKASAYGATIGGGGSTSPADGNQVHDHFGTIGGGIGNRAGYAADGNSDDQWATVAGGNSNEAVAAYAAIGGGINNDAVGYGSTIGGGFQNRAGNSAVPGNWYSTVAGGGNNHAQGNNAAIGGGGGNIVNGAYSTIPGGEYNSANGSYSFAAGRNAQANHNGCFVWADSSAYSFGTSGNNQFNVRATGGLNFVTGIDGSSIPANRTFTFGTNGEFQAPSVMVAETLSAKVVELRGADVAEPFAQADGETAEPGTVMVIDNAHPGKLKPSTEAYDKKVAGVVSGAGGIRHGLKLSQEGITEGDTLVAMTGRVYVKATADGGAITPGDALTTSDVPGHAMKAADHSRTGGTVIGKAMSELEEGTGLVLVLVNLQ